MSGQQVNAVSNKVNLFSEQARLDVDTKTARKNWVNNQIKNYFNFQNTLPPCGDWFQPQGNTTATAHIN